MMLPRQDRQAIASRIPRRYHRVLMKRKLGLFAYAEERNCPVCGSEHVHRTKRGRFLEFWILLFLPYRPYRCGKCRSRFYGPKEMPRRDQLEHPEALIED